MKHTLDKFWRIKNAADEGEGAASELILYGDISSYSWYDDDVTPAKFNEDFDAIKDSDNITVRINSGGGDVFAAYAIYSRLRDCKAYVTVKIDGWAASAATIIAMAGDEIQIPACGVFMVHNPSYSIFLGSFNSEQLKKMSTELDTIAESISICYEKKTKKSRKECQELMNDETYLTGEQAVKEGFCDKLMNDDEIPEEIDNKARMQVINSVSAGLNVRHGAAVSGRFFNKSQESGTQEEKTERNGTAMPEEIKDIAELKAKYPKLCGDIENSAAEAERQRINEIQNIGIPGYDDIITAAEFDSPRNAADVALEIIGKIKQQGTDYLANRNKDAEDVNGVSGAKGKSSATEKADKKAEREKANDEALDRFFSKGRDK